jgi:hypothetical protein
VGRGPSVRDQPHCQVGAAPWTGACCPPPGATATGPRGHDPAAPPADDAAARGRHPAAGDRHPRGPLPQPRALAGRRPPGPGGEPGRRRRRQRAEPAAVGQRAAHGRGRADRRVAGRHALLRRHDRRPARQRGALPARHDGPVRGARPGPRPAAGPAAARPAVGAGRQLVRPGGAGAVHGRALRRPAALPGGPGRAGAVEGAQRAAGGRRPPRPAPGADADLCQCPALRLRPGHLRRGRCHRRRCRVGLRVPPGAVGDRRGVRRRRRARRPPAPARRRPDRRAGSAAG